MAEHIEKKNWSNTAPNEERCPGRLQSQQEVEGEINEVPKSEERDTHLDEPNCPWICGDNFSKLLGGKFLVLRPFSSHQGFKMQLCSGAQLLPAPGEPGVQPATAITNLVTVLKHHLLMLAAGMPSHYLKTTCSPNTQTAVLFCSANPHFLMFTTNTELHWSLCWFHCCIIPLSKAQICAPCSNDSSKACRRYYLYQSLNRGGLSQDTLILG